MGKFVNCATVALGVSLSSCAIMPDLPPDWALPMQEILLHSACELQYGLREIDGRVIKSRFDARNWKIALTPEAMFEMVRPD